MAAAGGPALQEILASRTIRMCFATILDAVVSMESSHLHMRHQNMGGNNDPLTIWLVLACAHAQAPGQPGQGHEHRARHEQCVLGHHLRRHLLAYGPRPELHPGQDGLAAGMPFSSTPLASCCVQLARWCSCQAAAMQHGAAAMHPVLPAAATAAQRGEGGDLRAACINRTRPSRRCFPVHPRVDLNECSGLWRLLAVAWSQGMR